MTPTKEQIDADVEGLKYLFRLKREIRYAQKREVSDYTESVAEHVYGMQLVAQFFITKIEEAKSVNSARVYELITIHDLDEIETGDILGYLKTPAIRMHEAEMAKKVITRAPLSLQSKFTNLIDEYNKQETLEARFVKAVDRFEPLIHLFEERGKKILHVNNTTIAQSKLVKDKYIKVFPIMYDYYVHIHERMIAEGYFLS
jgi:5'-deoxynucleotidase YfbR-like HD superfamily hydrolase